MKAWPLSSTVSFTGIKVMGPTMDALAAMAHPSKPTDTLSGDISRSASRLHSGSDDHLGSHFATCGAVVRAMRNLKTRNEQTHTGVEHDAKADDSIRHCYWESGAI